jgi:hypothetical protein
MSDDPPLEETGRLVPLFMNRCCSVLFVSLNTAALVRFSEYSKGDPITRSPLLTLARPCRRSW